VPKDLHEWVSFEDPTEQRSWQFDVTFLASNYSCIFGNGCKGVLSEDTTNWNQGCCSYGAHLIDENDKANLLKHAKRLTAEQWQHKPSSSKAPLTEANDEGIDVTVLVDDACIFLNRPGFEGGAGCALHIGAMQAGERFLDWKPEVCWQVPLRREDYTDVNGWVTTTVREWKAVWESMQDEITEMSSPFAYEKLTDYMTERRKSKAVPLPHPAVRKKKK
jgi:uncharacterized protein (DUF302 family)